MFWYSNYKGRCRGRVLHAIEVYCGYYAVDKAIPDYSWKDDTDIPVFNFSDPEHNKRQFFLQPYLDDDVKAMNFMSAYHFVLNNLTIWDFFSWVRDSVKNGFNYYIGVSEQIKFLTIKLDDISIYCEWNDTDVEHILKCVYYSVVNDLGNEGQDENRLASNRVKAGTALDRKDFLITQLEKRHTTNSLA